MQKRSKARFSPADLLNLKAVADPQLSPDAGQVAYVLVQPDQADNRYRSAVWTVPAGGGRPVRRTAGKGRDWAPRWSPDGRWIAFLTDRDGEPALWLAPTDFGEAGPLAGAPKGILSPPFWSPDGRHIAVLARAPEQPGERLSEPAKDVVVVTRLRYKWDGQGIYPPGRPHLWLVPVDGGPARQLTFGAFDCGLPAWSPDGRYLAFPANQNPDADHGFGQDLWRVDVVTGEMSRILAWGGPILFPAWSPDGGSLAYLGHQGERWSDPSTKLWVVQAGGGQPVELTAELDRPAMPAMFSDAMVDLPLPWPAWSAQGDRVYFLASDRGACHVYSVSRDGGPVRRESPGGGRCAFQFSRSASGRLVYLYSDPLTPAAIAACDKGQEAELTLVDPNPDVAEIFGLTAPETVRFPSHDGLEIEGWLLRPPDHPTGEKRPLVLCIHGGPHGAYGYTFEGFSHALAAAGYLVLYLNPRGSQSYGQVFCSACVEDWGGADFGDLMAGVDHLIARGEADPERLGVTGYSYGGFMTNWVVGQTDRFRAAVSGGGLSNLVSFYGTSDVGYIFGRQEQGASPWEKVERLLERSPLTHAHRVKTPTLIYHGEQDDRCAVEQSEQFFIALKQLGVETEFVRYPGASHLFIINGKPAQRLDFMTRALAWFDRYLRPEGRGG